MVITFGCVVRSPKPAPRSFPLQKKRAIALQQAWGGKPCPHPAFAKEYDLGERTGSHICTQCGATFTHRQKVELVAARSAHDESAQP